MTQEVKKGSWIKDNDPRSKDNPSKEVLAIEDVRGTKYAVYKAGKRKARIRLDRIFQDGAVRKVGWTLVTA